MDQEKIEELKKLAKPIQDFMASNSDLNAGEYSFNSKHEL